MSTLEDLRDVLAVLEAAPSVPAPSKSTKGEPKDATGGVQEELRRAVATLTPEARNGLQAKAREIEAVLGAVLADEVRRVAELADAPALARLVAERLAPPRVGELTPSHEALTAAFARGTAKAIAATRAAGLPVHAMRDGRVVEVPPQDT